MLLAVKQKGLLGDELFFFDKKQSAIENDQRSGVIVVRIFIVCMYVSVI